MSVAGSGELLEREGELGRIEAAIDGACAGTGSIVLVEGPAGIGKTALLREARRIAAGRMGELTARATQLEREFAFGIVRQLLEPPLRAAAEGRRRELLGGPAAHAAPALGLTDGGVGAEPGFATLNGLYWLLSDLAEEQPLLLVLDDAHWADRDSLRFLAFIAPRVADLPVLLLLAARSDDWRPDAALAATASDPAASALMLAPLSSDASARLVAGVFDAPVHPEFARACHAATGGNPFYLRALVDELRRDRATPSEEAAARVLGLGPHAVSRVILARLGSLSAAAPRLVAAVAVLGDVADPGRAARLAGLDRDGARSAAAELADVSILEPGERYRFAHPIIRNAVYEELGPRERAGLHGRAVDLLGADPEFADRVPGHLLAVEPAGDPEVVATLRLAAGAALKRGAIGAAVSYLRRAVAEPPPDDSRAEVTLELGEAEAQLLDPDALGHLEAGLAGVHDPVTRGRGLAALGLARYLHGDAAGAAAALREAIEPIPPGAGGTAEAYLLLTLFMAGRAVPALVDDLGVLLEPPRTGSGGEPTHAEVARGLALAFDAFLRGRREQALGRLDRAEALLAEISASLPETLMLGAFQCVLGRYGGARSNLDVAFEYARDRGSPMLMALALEGRTHLRWMTGDLTGAIADAETRVRLGGREWDPATTLVRVMLAICLVDRGDTEAASQALDLPERAEKLLPGMWGWLWLPYGRARVALARGDWEAARDDALAAGERLLEIQAPTPEYLPWRSLAAQALVQLGERGRAAELAREELELAREMGSARAAGVALGALASIDRGGDELGLHQEAAELLAGSPAQLEHARALVGLGAAIRRTGRRADAREPLAEGMELAKRCGAVALADRAYAELRASGARPRKPSRTGLEDLTPSELRVARMAAEGMTNREIAESLFVTVKTVEFHLGQTYRKLEISSRDELGPVLR
ncbi:MAG TPA: AAA family ATPase [Solirubrobacterales bacterium]|nr:AAA family ATPase [Solirubrobacterales bacterium]